MFTNKSKKISFAIGSEIPIFNTHAFHGLHGRALTYATGIKMARPDLKVIVTMGDGGLVIGGAHVLSTCRRNIDLTLLVLNNFNYGMTGGQCSSTTPQDGSGFLNKLEKPMGICLVAGAAGAGTCHPGGHQNTGAGNLVCRIDLAEGIGLRPADRCATHRNIQTIL